MIRHISIFYVKKNTDYEKNIECLERELQRMEPQIEGAAEYYSGKNLTRIPENMEGIPLFGDCVQVIDFLSQEYADLYPASEAHIALQKKVGGLIEKVAAADLWIEA